MGLNNANFIEGLNPNDPDYNDLVSDAASHVRAIKRAFKQTFAGVTGAVTAGPTALNSFEGRIQALEASALSSTPMASGREHLPAAGQLTVNGIPFQPTLVFVVAAKGGAEVDSQATVSFGVTDGTTQFCHTHKVVYTGTGGMTVGNASYTDRVAQVDAFGGDAMIAFNSFIADGFTLTQSGTNPTSTITWTAWR